MESSSEDYVSEHRYVLDVHDLDERMALSLLTAAVEAMRVGSTCSVAIGGFAGKPYLGGQGDLLVWGHLDEKMSDDEISFVDQHLRALNSYYWAEKSSRVGNALRLYSSAIVTRDSTLALLGCVGAIESLFSIAPQELSFRLSLYLARFLGDAPDSQKALFDRARALYGVRSKIAHGDSIAPSDERAAISLVEHWTPEAAELARLCLKRVFDRGLLKLFDSKQQHAELLTSLLFAPNLDAATG